MFRYAAVNPHSTRSASGLAPSSLPAGGRTCLEYRGLRRQSVLEAAAHRIHATKRATWYVKNGESGDMYNDSCSAVLNHGMARVILCLQQGHEMQLHAGGTILAPSSSFFSRILSIARDIWSMEKGAANS